MLVLNQSRNIFKSQWSLPKEYPIRLKTHSTKVHFPQQKDNWWGEGWDAFVSGQQGMPAKASVCGHGDGPRWHTRSPGEKQPSATRRQETFLLLKLTYTRPTPCRASLVAQLVKNSPTMQETWVRSLGWENPLEKGKATHSSVLAWRIPWTL